MGVTKIGGCHYIIGRMGVTPLALCQALSPHELYSSTYTRDSSNLLVCVREHYTCTVFSSVQISLREDTLLSTGSRILVEFRDRVSSLEKIVRVENYFLALYNVLANMEVCMRRRLLPEDVRG